MMNKETLNEHEGKYDAGLKIWKYQSELPIVQWWMGIGISMAELAWAVALNGGVWTLSSAWLCDTPTYKHILRQAMIDAKKTHDWKVSLEQGNEIFLTTNCQVIGQEVQKAKEIAQWKGPVFMNIMAAAQWFKEQVLAACKAWIDGIVCGAGLPMNLPDITKDFPNIALVPILSNLRGVKIIVQNRIRKYQRLPDAIILEDPTKAGGHLWVKNLEDLKNADSNSDFILENSIPAVKKYFEEEWYSIPIIAAGWIVNHVDVMRILNLWASGVQMWTRFLASKESGANQEFKQAVVNSTENDITEYMSSAGLPARALKQSEIFARMADISAQQRDCIKTCLQQCGFKNGNPLLAQMCILKELIRSTAWGKWKWLWFVWTSATKINEVLTVQEIMETFKQYFNPTMGLAM